MFHLDEKGHLCLKLINPLLTISFLDFLELFTRS